MKVRTLSLAVFVAGMMLLVCPSTAQSGEQKKTFEYLWKLFDERYASFEEKGIDWGQVYDQYSSKVTDKISDEELFIVFTQMLQPLGDAHINLIAKSIDTAFSADRPSRIMDELSSIEGRKKPHLIKMMDETLNKHGFGGMQKLGPVFRNDTLFSYARTEKIGYLRFFRSFRKLSNMVGPGSTLDDELDEIFTYFNGVKSIIIDVRFNVGGDDGFSQKVAGRFVEEKIVGFKKQTRANKEFGALKEKFIEPTEAEPFFGPVVLLTNDQTFSAADVLALMMASLPNVTLIGEPSNGSYSDLWGRKLPNGWRVTLSNQRYYSVDMQNYEGVGTPVDLEVKNMLKDIETGNDSVLEEAINFLNK